MPKDKLAHLGSCIRAARHDCKLTQQELADDCHVAIKTIQNIEKGQMNPSFEILYPIVNRLGISANILFNPNTVFGKIVSNIRTSPKRELSCKN